MNFAELRPPPFLQALLGGDFHETFDAYVPSDTFMRIVQPLLGKNWSLTRSGIWRHCYAEDQNLPSQGWKIHVSATVLNCNEILRLVAAKCVALARPFKFLADERILSGSNSKVWDRGSSGKFMTIYPYDENDFRLLIESLHRELRDFSGPYILSDRRFRDSRVLYYRYGGIRPRERLTYRGNTEHILETPSGELVPDKRLPQFTPPDWVVDPFPSVGSVSPDALTLSDGRYRIRRVLRFTNSGGVYLADDSETGQTVVIKEARPFVQMDREGIDSIARLRVEHEILTQLRGTGIGPEPIQLFEDWEHLFLAMEFVEGDTLHSYLTRINPLIKTDPSRRTIQDFMDSVRDIWLTLARSLAHLHDNGIVFGDLSPTNVLVDRNEGSTRLIDFEGAYRTDAKSPSLLYTPGFASSGHVGGVDSGPQNDCFSLGAIMAYSIWPVVVMLSGLAPECKNVFFQEIRNDLGLGNDGINLIRRLLEESNESRKRPDASSVARFLGKNTMKVGIPQPAALPEMATLRQTLKDACSYIISVATPHRRDRLFPSDLRLFNTNPLSFSFGAVGVAYALQLVNGEVPDEITKWILSHPVGSELYPPGLYVGASGIAWGLAEIGEVERAIEIIDSTAQHPLLGSEICPDVFAGLAGWGLANLYFWLRLREERFLDRVVSTAEDLSYAAIENELGLYWPQPDGTVNVGYAKGASGIALFLLYAYLATEDKRFLRCGSRGLDFDLAHGVVDPEGSMCFPSVGLIQQSIGYPYWQMGGAGVGTTLLRYWYVTRNPDLLPVISSISSDTAKKYAIRPGLFSGLSGLGNFLLDCFQMIGDPVFLSQARKVASGILLFRISRPSGIAFPGDQLARISTDIASGSAGVALFLWRTLTDAGQFNLTLDNLFFPKVHSSVGSEHVSVRLADHVTSIADLEAQH